VTTTTTTAPSTTTNNTVSSTSTAPSLVHPPGTTSTHAPENPRDAHEFGTLLRDSLAGMGADMFGLGSLLSHSDTPTSPQTPRTSTSTTTPSTGGPSSLGGTTTTPSTPRTPTFDRNRRREQLTNDTLERLNMVRAEQGQSPLADLPATEAAAIETQLDSEERASGSPGGGGATDAPVMHNWSEFGDQFRLAGGEFLGSMFGINPVERAAERHREEAARTQQQQPGGTGTHTTSTAGAGAAAGAAAATGSIGHPDRQAPPEPTGAELARLYDRIHTRLVHELLVGRERSGSLMDFR
jgi:hypothetical protein